MKLYILTIPARTGPQRSGSVGYIFASRAVPRKSAWALLVPGVGGADQLFPLLLFPPSKLSINSTRHSLAINIRRSL